ncbi:MAG: hypothetical protein V5A57_00170 [Candidatus Paceibacterota bacterium]
MFDNKHSLVRTIYLYLFALLGLALITIGTVRLVDLGLKTYVFTKADQQFYAVPGPQLKPGSEVDIEKLVENCKNDKEISQEQRDFLAAWSEDHQQWKQKQESNERLKSQRQEKAANSLALLIVGLPLFVYHWKVIKRETEIKEAA